jgi:signal transduction histidine kinase
MFASVQTAGMRVRDDTYPRVFGSQRVSKEPDSPHPDDAAQSPHGDAMIQGNSLTRSTDDRPQRESNDSGTATWHGESVLNQSRDPSPLLRSYWRSTPASDSPGQIARDVAIVGRLEGVPLLLETLCDATGMRFAVVARVTDRSWTACAVKDDIGFGLLPGDQLDVDTTLCIEAKRSRAPIVIDHASLDPRYCHHATPRLYKIESYISVPIVLSDGRYFGNLCAIDPAPAKVSEPRITGMFIRFAALIALQYDNEMKQARDHSALIDERAAGELREQFIAVLGHDLRNPLQAITAISEMLAKKVSDPYVLDMVGRITDNSRRMSSLINDVLDFARGRLGGGISINPQETDDLHGALMAVVNELQDAHPDHPIAARFKVTRPVRCDLGRVQQLASNLIGNAMSHGTPRSMVEVVALTDDEDFILKVWNEGDPIPPEHLDKAFEPFWRRSAGAGREGLGLGLHICAQIVRAHGGALTVTSTKEAGTTFTVRMPLVSSEPV